jgi:hypothetical protein
VKGSAKAGAGEAYEPAPYRGILRVRGMADAPPGTPIAEGIGELLAGVEAGVPDAELKARVLAWARAIR